MADEQEHPQPGAFGVDRLTREVREFRQHLDERLAQQQRETQSLLTHQHRETHAANRRIEAALRCIEGVVNKMPDQFDGLRQLISEQSATIQQEASQINAKLAENTALIQQLQDTINQGVPVPQDVVDALLANNTAIGGFIPDTVPEPTPEPVPQGRRK